jgi:hypothetical protein
MACSALLLVTSLATAQPATVPFAPASTPEQEKLRVVPAKRLPGKVHLLPATMETTQWGWFNNAQPPVLHVDSGDTIIFETMMHSHNQVVPGVTIEQIKKLRTDFPGRGPHTITGPVYIEGAEPGMVLKVKIDKIVPRAYGTNFNVPGMFGNSPIGFRTVRSNTSISTPIARWPNSRQASRFQYGHFREFSALHVPNWANTAQFRRDASPAIWTSATRRRAPLFMSQSSSRAGCYGPGMPTRPRVMVRST